MLFHCNDFIMSFLLFKYIIIKKLILILYKEKMWKLLLYIFPFWIQLLFFIIISFKFLDKFLKKFMTTVRCCSLFRGHFLLGFLLIFFYFILITWKRITLFILTVLFNYCLDLHHQCILLFYDFIITNCGTTLIIWWRFNWFLWFLSHWFGKRRFFYFIFWFLL